MEIDEAIPVRTASILQRSLEVIRAFARSAVLRVKSLPLSLRLDVLSAIVPKRFWFPTVVSLSRLQGRLSSLRSPEKTGWAQAIALEWWLDGLTVRSEFAVRCRTVGLEIFSEAELPQGGTLLCGVHLPNMRMVVRVLVERGTLVSFVVTAPQHITAEGRWLPTGWPKGLHPILQGPETMMQMRRHLRDGGLGAIMMDRDPGGPLYPNGMRLAGRIGARVILTWVEMEADGIFTVTYREAPHPVPDTEEKVLENLAVLEEQRTRILGTLKYVVSANSFQDKEDVTGATTAAIK